MMDLFFCRYLFFSFHRSWIIIGNAIKDILNSVADLTIYTNLQLQIQFANTAACELFQQKEMNTTWRTSTSSSKYTIVTSNDSKYRIFANSHL